MVHSWARRRVHSSERGAAAVELAIVLVPLLILVFSIATLGELYFTKLRLNQAARDAARTVALHADDPDLPLLGGLIGLTNDTLETVLGDELYGQLTVKLIDDCSAGDAVVTLGTAEDVNLPFIDIGGGDGQVDLLAEATMRCEA